MKQQYVCSEEVAWLWQNNPHMVFSSGMTCESCCWPQGRANHAKSILQTRVKLRLVESSPRMLAITWTRENQDGYEEKAGDTESNLHRPIRSKPCLEDAVPLDKYEVASALFY